MLDARAVGVDACELVTARSEEDHAVEPDFERAKGAIECLQHVFARTTRCFQKRSYGLEQPPSPELAGGSSAIASRDVLTPPCAEKRGGYGQDE